MRLFIAVKPDRKILDIAEKSGKILKNYCKIKVVEPGNMHITLAFLGEQQEKSLPAIKESMDKVKTYFPVTVKFTEFSYFKRGGVPSVFFLKGESDKLEIVVNELRNRLKNSKIKYDDKRFVIHLTVGRIKNVKSVNDFYKIIEKLNLNFSEYKCSFDRPILYKSTLTPTGPVYDSLY